MEGGNISSSDQLEAAGIRGGFEGSKARRVLIQNEAALEALLNPVNAGVGISERMNREDLS